MILQRSSKSLFRQTTYIIGAHKLLDDQKKNSFATFLTPDFRTISKIFPIFSDTRSVHLAPHVRKG